MEAAPKATRVPQASSSSSYYSSDTEPEEPQAKPEKVVVVKRYQKAAEQARNLRSVRIAAVRAGKLKSFRGKRLESTVTTKVIRIDQVTT